jgi:hypothetical protein
MQHPARHLREEPNGATALLSSPDQGCCSFGGPGVLSILKVTVST